MAIAQEYFDTYHPGITVQIARDFIMDNFSALTLVYNTLITYGINNDMVAEILASDFPGLTGEIVSDFFDSNGFNGTELGFNMTEIDNLEIQNLLFMIEEEKMARDIYDVLYEITGINTFDRISESEQKHYDTLLSTAERLNIDTSFLSSEPGVFTNEDVQDLYDDLILQGSQSTQDAIEVGILIEEVDISDLYNAIETTEIVELDQVYTNLLNASVNHLTAFENIA